MNEKVAYDAQIVTRGDERTTSNLNRIFPGTDVASTLIRGVINHQTKPSQPASQPVHDAHAHASESKKRLIMAGRPET